jgi:hypothetical protein
MNANPDGMKAIMGGTKANLKVFAATTKPNRGNTKFMEVL